MAVVDNFNMIELMKQGLKQQVKEELTEDIVADHMFQIEKDFRKMLKPLVESISIDMIELNRINDMRGLMDEFKVYVEIRDGGEK